MHLCSSDYWQLVSWLPFNREKGKSPCDIFGGQCGARSIKSINHQKLQNYHKLQNCQNLQNYHKLQNCQNLQKCQNPSHAFSSQAQASFIHHHTNSTFREGFVQPWPGASQRLGRVVHSARGSSQFREGQEASPGFCYLLQSTQGPGALANLLQLSSVSQGTGSLHLPISQPRGLFCGQECSVLCLRSALCFVQGVLCVVFRSAQCPGRVPSVSGEDPVCQDCPDLSRTGQAIPGVLQCFQDFPGPGRARRPQDCTSHPRLRRRPGGLLLLPRKL